MLALPWKIFDRLSCQRSTYMYILINQWMATNTTGSYLSKIAKRSKSRHLYITCSKCPPPALTKISDVDELRWCITNRWADLNHAVHLTTHPYALRLCWRQTFRACGATMMWANFWDNNYQSCLWLFDDSLKCTCKYFVDGSIFHIIFPKVVLAHIVGEVGILCKVLLSVSSRICLPIFIEMTSSKKLTRFFRHTFLSR